MSRFKSSLVRGTVLLVVASAHALQEARSDDIKPGFTKLIVTFARPRLRPSDEQLSIESNGQCWYRSAAVVGHMLSPERIERLNAVLKDTAWLTAKGGEGPATHTDAETITVTLDRSDKRASVECHGRRPEPYAALLLEFESLAIQERRICLHDHVGGEDGARAWQDIGREMNALMGGPYAKSTYAIDYQRYVPIAQRIVGNFYRERDDELVPAVRLIGYFKRKSELKSLHHMAHDRSSYLRREVAQALGEIHDKASLPVLVDMMEATGTQCQVGFELIQWGGDATDDIVTLIGLSTDDKLTAREHVIGENMIRAYLDNWSKIDQPIQPRVIAAIQEALDHANTQKSIRTTYHKEFLRKVSGNPAE